MLFLFSISGAVSVLLWPGFGVPGLFRGQITPELVTREPMKDQLSLSEAFNVFFFPLPVSQAWMNVFHVHLFTLVKQKKTTTSRDTGMGVMGLSPLYYTCFVSSGKKYIISTDSSRKWMAVPIPYMVMLNFLVTIYPVCFDFDSWSSADLCLIHWARRTHHILTKPIQWQDCSNNKHVYRVRVCSHIFFTWWISNPLFFL